MFAIAAVTGRVGGATARALLKAGHPVRAVVRDLAKAAPWRALGAQIAVADFGNLSALTRAFEGAEGAFLMVPPNFTPAPGFPDARAAVATQVEAARAAGVRQVVALSSIGGHRPHGLGLITQARLLEEALRDQPFATAILRPGWFMENSIWDIELARKTGEMASFLAPLDRPYPMVATADIGQVAAEVLPQRWSGRRVIEVTGPKRYSQNEIATLLGRALGRAVSPRAVARDQWESLFKSQGSVWPTPRVEMLDGFMSGWIDFEPGVHEHVVGTTPYETVLTELARS